MVTDCRDDSPEKSSNGFSMQKKYKDFSKQYLTLSVLIMNPIITIPTLQELNVVIVSNNIFKMIKLK